MAIPTRPLRLKKRLITPSRFNRSSAKHSSRREFTATASCATSVPRSNLTRRRSSGCQIVLSFSRKWHMWSRLGDWDAAEKHYRAAVELDPRNVTSLSGLADFLGLCRHSPEAQATWDRILQISPGDEVAIASKALNFQAEGRLEDS